MNTPNNNSEPIFKSIFGDKWENLPVVLKKHYANRPFSTDRTIVEGILNVRCQSVMNMLRPFYRFLGLIPAVTQTNVPVTVYFDSSQEDKAFHFNRIFYFKNTSPYEFRSKMIHTKGNEVLEIMHFGFCWRTTFDYENNKVLLRHKGYALKVCNWFIPLPITLLMGRGDAEERAIDDDHFDMKVEITHFIFGVIYSYAGQFKVVSTV